MNNLEDRWQHLTLIEVEKMDEVMVDKQKIVEEAKRGKLGIVGKLMVEKLLTKKSSE